MQGQLTLAEIKAVKLNADGWPDTDCCRDKTHIPDLCRMCKAALYYGNVRRLREFPDDSDPSTRGGSVMTGREC